MPPRNMVYIPFCLIFRSVLPKRKSLNTERMNSQSAPASHQDGWRGWDRTNDRLINSQLIYLWSTRQKLVPQDGLEPPTTGFGDQDSTNWTTAEQSQNGRTRGNRTLVEGLKVLCLTFQLWSQKLHNKIVLNSKSNREGRSTHTVIILYKTQQVN